MKRNCQSIVFFVLVVVLYGCGTTHKGSLVWKETFSGRQLDSSRWSRIPRGNADWCNYMSMDDSCFDMRKGKLVLKGIRNRHLPNDTAPYLTGGVYTKHKVTFGPGRVEIRAKLGEAGGCWPAFWMLPDKAKWPNGGEIDIMEHLNFDSIAYQTVHSHYTYVLKKDTHPAHYSTGIIKRNAYNVYAVEISADSLAFFINDRHTFTYPRIPKAQSEGQYPFVDEPFYLLLDMQLGGNWVGKVNPDDLPVQMEIDWVKYYRKKE
ncbi:glycoside hydrolase family 16 protein [Bacteroides helcogenes]|uniref:Glycoside hydrolase family 16 n=1 Tax=Bacteroides helcogenes (strain ATCC 35417 / DSM 20613 / JCM 6297 / CCUG 15421 / P 36-108) TaxID=693979 RepID=E6SNE5_BACT6|nr:glycoside hydrolase family 16 protein [Bacteroides helcogenes]ADV42738.1 glycoside hydrolase family 16 [Bacteroides helcogenes P 36-108]MDY5239569.1 glycoside hydrolase family 16 protein [Bacteroides helcogenes]